MDRAPIAAERVTPTRLGSILFHAKALCFRLRRIAREVGRAPRRLPQPAPASMEGAILGESRTLLYPSAVPAEFALQAGKVQNLRIAARCMDGTVIRDGDLFSFWAQVGRPTRRRGFAHGRELREGCIIPSIGGGLCQLSNALYDAALNAGAEIVERHPHSQRVPGSMAAIDRDATVFWNYVDLRFRPRTDCRLEVELTGDQLLVRLRALHAGSPKDSSPQLEIAHGPNYSPAESCETCGMTGCFRHREASGDTTGVTAWLLDAWWPEHDEYWRQHRSREDWLFLPMRGRSSYQWDLAGVQNIREARLQTLLRAWKSRRLAAQGAERQRALLGFDAALARSYARCLPVEALHLVISQNLLPHLWRAGVLGGRTFDVLMTRLPMAELHRALDCAAARHPDSRTLADFRAPADLAAAESEALREARHWITPHSAIARIAGPRAVKLEWHVPARRAAAGSGAGILFPASTLARKGAYELAAASKSLGLHVQLAGPILEPQCWSGADVSPARPGWDGVGAVVLPAWVEHQPRALLEAVARGLPVIAGTACGLEGVPGVATVPEGDVDALADALEKIFAVPVTR